MSTLPEFEEPEADRGGASCGGVADEIDDLLLQLDALRRELDTLIGASARFVN